MLRPHSVAVGASALFVSVAFAARSAPPRAQDEGLELRLARRVEAFVAEHEPSALAVVVDVGGETLLARGWGERGRRPVDAHTAFPAGPLTEVCVAAGVMQRVARGDVALDARLGSVLEEFAEDERPITVGQLLGHASGLPPLDEHPALRRGEAPDTAALVAWLREAPTYAEPGHCFLYSDADRLLAGLVLERLGGASVRTWIEREVVAGLDLEDTRYSDAPDTGVPYAGAQLAAGRLESDGDAPALFEARALRSSAADLARVQRALGAGGLVDEATWRRMTQSGVDREGAPSNHGLGVALATLDDRACARWGGRSLGAGLLVAWYPALDLTVALLAEDEEVPIERLERALVRSFLERPDPELGDLELTPEQRAVYLGDYYLGCTRLTIADGEDGHLRALDAEGRERVLLAQGAHRFVVQGDPEVRYTFEVDGELATAFVLEEYGTHFRAVRID